ncbi:MAG: hypothetical protein ACMXYA_00310 [Candidatus Woesearchaeota archaeon]
MFSNANSSESVYIIFDSDGFRSLISEDISITRDDNQMSIFQGTFLRSTNWHGLFEIFTEITPNHYRLGNYLGVNTSRPIRLYFHNQTNTKIRMYKPLVDDWIDINRVCINDTISEFPQDETACYMLKETGIVIWTTKFSEFFFERPQTRSPSPAGGGNGGGGGLGGPAQLREYEAEIYQSESQIMRNFTFDYYRFQQFLNSSMQNRLLDVILLRYSYDSSDFSQKKDTSVVLPVIKNILAIVKNNIRNIILTFIILTFLSLLLKLTYMYYTEPLRRRLRKMLLQRLRHEYAKKLKKISSSIQKIRNT